MTASQYDLIVVGAGIAGLATAYFYKCQFPEHSVLVLERKGSGGIGSGLSGRSGGHRMPGFEADYSEVEKLLGEQRAQELYLETIRTSQMTDHIIRDEGIMCGARHGYWIVDGE
ncbi:MAG: FAD-dependent oxidoreductase, partial [Alphaproteobacteria bacterium]|nr:FAD-dependent oxidoreductase [Alphaproteobacteria bacterium]